ncbi:MAG: MATE family efflux transporter [Dethiobacteria bacterium]|nr:MATE family efflux transporter [Dethiobacteria bacterium]
MKNPLALEISYPSVLRYTLPTVAMMLFMATYTIIDSLFVSILINTDALAAINIVFPGYSIIMATGAMLAAGGSAIVAREMGRGENALARRIFTYIILVCLGLSVAFALIGYLGMEQFLGWLGAEGELRTYSEDYYFPLLFFLPTIMLQMLFGMFFITAGHPKLGFYLTVAAGVTNALLDYFFIGVLGMGISGAALATGIGTTIPALCGTIFFFRRNKPLHYARPLFRLSILIEASINGASEMVTYLATGFSTLLFNWSALRLIGVDGVAAVAILLYSEFLLNAVFYGFAQGVAPLISYNHGSNNSAKLQKIIRICVNLIALCAIAVFLVANLGAVHIVGMFASRNQVVFEIALNGFFFFSFCFLWMGFNIYASAMFTALSNGKLSALIAFLRTFVFITLGILFLPRFFGVNGLWLALPGAETLTVVIAAALVWREFRHHARGTTKAAR